MLLTRAQVNAKMSPYEQGDICIELAIARPLNSRKMGFQGRVPL